MEFLFEDTVAGAAGGGTAGLFPRPQGQVPHSSRRSRSARSSSARSRGRRGGGGRAADPRAPCRRHGPGAADEGDALLLGETFSRTPLSRVAALFGDDFARALAQAAPGRWVGPAAVGLRPAPRPGHGGRAGRAAAVRAGARRRWSASGSPSAAPRRRPPSTRPCSPATRWSCRSAGGDAMRRVALRLGLLAAAAAGGAGPARARGAPGLPGAARDRRRTSS